MVASFSTHMLIFFSSFPLHECHIQYINKLNNWIKFGIFTRNNLCYCYTAYRKIKKVFWHNFNQLQIMIYFHNDMYEYELNPWIHTPFFSSNHVYIFIAGVARFTRCPRHITVPYGAEHIRATRPGLCVCHLCPETYQHQTTTPEKNKATSIWWILFDHT